MKRASRLAALLLLAAGQAPAFDQGVEAALSLSREHVDLDAGTETRLSRISLSLSEQVRPFLALGLHGGPLLLTQSGNPATAGMELAGYHAGVSARAELFRQSPVGLAAGLSYSYQRAEGDDDDREVAVSLHEARGELAALLRLQSVQLQLGVYALQLEGDEIVAGTIASSTRLDADATAGGFLQADFLVDPTGRVGLRLDGGAKQAATLTFARRF